MQQCFYIVNQRWSSEKALGRRQGWFCSRLRSPSLHHFHQGSLFPKNVRVGCRIDKEVTLSVGSECVGPKHAHLTRLVDCALNPFPFLQPLRHRQESFPRSYCKGGNGGNLDYEMWINAKQ